MQLAEMIKHIPHCNTKLLDPEIADMPLVGWGSDVKPYKYPDEVQNREPVKDDAYYAAQYANFLSEQFETYSPETDPAELDSHYWTKVLNQESEEFETLQDQQSQICNIINFLTEKVYSFRLLTEMNCFDQFIKR